MQRGPSTNCVLCWTLTLSVAAMGVPANPLRAEEGGEDAGVEIPARGPLRAHPTNPRYFSDGTGRVVYLTGSHTWPNVVDIGPSDPPPRFDFEKYLDFLESYGHNFTRLWTWEPVTWNTKGNRESQLHHAWPQPYARTGPGNALDGKLKFDLETFHDAYFRRLRTRAEAASKRGIYVSVMLFEGWAMQFSPGAWEGHPFNKANNINGIDGDRNGDGKGLEVHQLGHPAVTKLQEAMVRKVVDELNDLDNVLFEISNENHPPSTDWQYHMIRWIHDYEKSKPKQHPVGMTFQYRGGSNRVLFDSPADWISPNHEGGYRDNPPAAAGRKVIVSDTDHLWGIGGDATWVWKTFLRGMNPIFMDPYDGQVLGAGRNGRWEPLRKSLGFTLRYARRVDLAKMTPEQKLASTGYCLAQPGRNYIVFLPKGGKVTVDLSPTEGPYRVRWFDPEKGSASRGDDAGGGGDITLEAPFRGPAVLYLAASNAASK